MKRRERERTLLSTINKTKDDLAGIDKVISAQSAGPIQDCPHGDALIDFYSRVSASGILVILARTEKN